jgi:hypothetical protein
MTMSEEWMRKLLEEDAGGDEPADEGEALKRELERQSREDAFGPDDPRDDDAIYAEAMENETWKSYLRGGEND